MKKPIKQKVKSVKLSKVEGTKYIPEMSDVDTSFDIKENSNTISKLDMDFGRGDLNLMRDKINEIIEHGN